MENSTSISVVLATYNGSRFLREQLHSLNEQYHRPFELVVCDDNSSDRTLDVVREFSAISRFPIVILENNENQGFSETFLRAARASRGEFIAFCDQDDVWLPNKLQCAARAIAQHSDVKVVLQNSIICDDELKPRDDFFPRHFPPGHYAPGSLPGFWVWPGFLQTFSRDLLRYLDAGPLPRSYFPAHPTLTHDKWVCLLGNTTGGVIILDSAAAFYRRHSATVTGSYAKQSVLDRISKSVRVEPGHYEFESRVAEETSVYLLDCAESSDSRGRLEFSQAARDFEILSEHLKARATFHACPNWGSRIAQYVRMIRRGAYSGRARSSLGGRSFLKDAGVALGIRNWFEQ